MSSLSSTAIEFSSAVELLALPVIVYRGVTKLLHGFVYEEVYHVPVIFLLSRLVGFTWAVLWMGGYLGERAFRLSEIFTPESIWNIPARTFLTREGNLFSYDVDVIWRWILSGDSMPATIAAGLAVLTIVGTAMLCFGMFDARRIRVAALLLSGITTVMIAGQTVYLITLALWLTHRVNFWSLILIALFIQYRRTNPNTHR